MSRWSDAFSALMVVPIRFTSAAWSASAFCFLRTSRGPDPDPDPDPDSVDSFIKSSISILCCVMCRLNMRLYSVSELSNARNASTSVT